jgi:hypothetical protein
MMAGMGGGQNPYGGGFDNTEQAMLNKVIEDSLKN